MKFGNSVGLLDLIGSIKVDLYKILPKDFLREALRQSSKAHYGSGTIGVLPLAVGPKFAFLSAKFSFFFYLGFLSQTFTIRRKAGEWGGYFFNSPLPLPPASQTLRH